jgi:ribosome-associated protein
VCFHPRFRYTASRDEYDGYNVAISHETDGRQGRTPRTEPLELAEKIADLLSDRQAQDIVLMDIGKVSTFTDYFLIATATNPRQMNALIDSLDRDLRADGVKPRRTEGAADSGWVLIDFNDVIVHLFAPEERDYYNLEELWGQSVSIVHMQ